MMDQLAELEAERSALQEDSDAERSSADRNRMGQFATPAELAVEIQRYAKAHLGRNEKVRFLDPAIGYGILLFGLAGCVPSITHY